MRSIKEISLLEIIQKIPTLASDPNIIAATAAIDEELRKTTESIPNIAIIPKLVRREIESNVLADMLADAFHVDFYGSNLALETKLELIVKSLDWHTRKGTPSAVEEVVTTVFGDAKVLEWFDYGGEPYTFKVTTSVTSVPAHMIGQLIDAIFSVKNTRSWLEGIEILHEAVSKWYVGIGTVRTIISNINAVFVPEPEIKTNWYFAGFVYMADPPLVVEGA